MIEKLTPHHCTIVISSPRASSVSRYLQKSLYHGHTRLVGVDGVGILSSLLISCKIFAILLFFFSGAGLSESLFIWIQHDLSLRWPQLRQCNKKIQLELTVFLTSTSATACRAASQCLLKWFIFWTGSRTISNDDDNNEQQDSQKKKRRMVPIEKNVCIWLSCFLIVLSDLEHPSIQWLLKFSPGRFVDLEYQESGELWVLC